jgi:hypothetical protein
MRLSGNISLSRKIDGRWYLIETCRLMGTEKLLGRPEGYLCFMDGLKYRRVFESIQTLQQGA